MSLVQILPVTLPAREEGEQAVKYIYSSSNKEWAALYKGADARFTVYTGLNLEDAFSTRHFLNKKKIRNTRVA